MTLTAVDWEDVRFFVALVRHRSLSATARALRVNHATVARRVAGLEAALGAALFERRPGGYELTDAGRRALDGASVMEGAAETLPRLESATRPLAGLLRLTATPTLTDSFLIRQLAVFHARHPALDIELIADHRSLSLPRREADIALRLGRPDDGELIARRLVTIRFAFYATPAWRDRIADGAAPAFVGFDEANAAVPEAAWLASRFPAGRLAMRSNSHRSQAIAARAGYGVALLPRFLGAGEADLVPIALAAAPPDRALWLLTRRDIRLVPRIRLATDFLVDLFGRERNLF